MLFSETNRHIYKMCSKNVLSKVVVPVRNHKAQGCSHELQLFSYRRRMQFGLVSVPTDTNLDFILESLPNNSQATVHKHIVTTYCKFLQSKTEINNFRRLEVKAPFTDLALVIGPSCLPSNDLVRTSNDETFTLRTTVRSISCIKMKKKMKVDKSKNKSCLLVLICEKFEKSVRLQYLLK